jgi:hypothetical protein
MRVVFQLSSSLSLDVDNRYYFVITAGSEVELAILGSGYIPNDASARRSWGARKFLCFGIKADQRFRFHSRFAVADSSVWAIAIS